ncbi:hypothetical protein CVT25_003647 [Psilocybe cyanescens]|uniref:Uncharacterized protein n=1 Tax=Psilocybe cyanescens TaxID=93625 RepID=A0A409WPC0_PSICY|nr:hypothetical protein CVT25_003647 [Psilocybe cyanescens]
MKECNYGERDGAEEEKGPPRIYKDVKRYLDSQSVESGDYMVAEIKTFRVDTKLAALSLGDTESGLGYMGTLAGYIEPLEMTSDQT